MSSTPSSTTASPAQQERVSVSRSAPLGEVLVSMGLIKAEELQAVLARQKADGRRLGDLLVADGRLSRDQVSRAIAQRMGVDFQSLADGVDPGVAHLIDDRSARRYSAVPVGLDPDGTLVVAMADPLNVLAIDDLRMVTRRDIRPVLALPEDIASVLRETREVDEVVEDLAEEARADDGIHALDLDSAVDQAPVVRFVNSVITRAVEEGASDIHFEPQARQMIVRYRVDGVLRQADGRPQPHLGRRRQPDQDHGRPRHRRAADAAGRPHRAHHRRPPTDLRVPACPPCTARRSSSGCWTRATCPCSSASSASRPRCWSASSAATGAPTAPCWSPGRPARARPPPSTPP